MGGTWSPDARVVFSYNSTSFAGFNGAPCSGPQNKSVSTLPGSEGFYSPQWSPDGHYVAALAPGDHLVLFDATTQEWTTVLALGVGFPSWSRDGQYIYCNTLWRQARP